MDFHIQTKQNNNSFILNIALRIFPTMQELLREL